MIYAVTGGIGSGKTYYCKQLEAQGLPVFNCDIEAKRIIRTDHEVKTQLIATVGPEVYDEQGQLQKAVLAAFICRGEAYANQVDRIVHPKVASVFKTWAREHLQTHKDVYMECALLYETGFDQFVDEVILVTANIETRIERVMARDNVTREKALAWMALQMPEEEKARRAHHIVRND
ncbi:MAG: dephospho-CoA kinase [Bacteroidaceae bacterium]|nr:dephospho-CoA kinase [Bacteroidaceae bacterium]